ncbi:hypothetical protein [Acidisoma sp. 7E03]
MFRLLSYRLDDHIISVSGSLGRLILQVSAPMQPGRTDWSVEQWADALLYELSVLLKGLEDTEGGS